MRHVGSYALIALLVAAALTAVALAKVFIETLGYSPGGPDTLAVETSSSPALAVLTFLNNIPYLAASAWIVFLALAVWKRRYRILWTTNGFDPDLFRVMTSMRGSKTRLAILKNLYVPKNRLQLAKDLGMHWESINNHIDILVRHGLIDEFISVGVAKYLMITDKGKKLMQLMESTTTELQ